jgi:pilus assembly protein CpaC
MRVQVPPVAQQVVLKVRFASVDRSNSTDLGLNIFNGSFNQQTSLGTGNAVFPDPKQGTFSVGQAINVLLIRKDINLGVELQALQAKRVLELLAEPNVLAISGEQASFLAGGEFPFPVVQPSQGGASAISIMWREYGVRLNFLPTVTPRGTIRLKVAPEVSSLDYTNAVTIQGFTVPGLSSRRVQTDVELDSGQSFVIAGLLDNQSSDNLSKVPGIANIPVLGKLFQTKSVSRSKQELLVIITPEVVRPIPPDQKVPELSYPLTFMSGGSQIPMSQPGMDKTGPVPVKPPITSLPFEQLVPRKDGPPVNFQPTPGLQMNPGQNLSAPIGPAPAPASVPGGSAK